MPGIGRLKNKISIEEEKEKEKPSPVSPPPTPIKPKMIPGKAEIEKPTSPPSEVPSPETALPSKWSQPPRSAPSLDKPATGKPEKFSPHSIREQLYKKIISDSQKEKLEQQQFIARIQGRSGPKEESPLPSAEEGKVVFQPVPQGPSRMEKILVRLLIVLLIASLGFLLYLVFRGYLI